MADVRAPEAVAVARAAGLLAQADALVVAAGAGMGVDSGLPDFRGNQGFWQAYPALGKEGVDFHSIACPDTFHHWPERAWGFYGHRLALYRATAPHAGFGILRRWASMLEHGGAVFTSNVDGQFQRAGFTGMPLHECHGSLHHMQCLEGCGGAIWPADAWVPDVDPARCVLRNALPRCPRCGAVARPNVLMFGDGGWLAARTESQGERLQQWLATVRRPVVVELGAGTAIPSVRHFGQWVVRARGGRLVRINPREPQVHDRGDAGIASGALAALQAIDGRLASG